MTPKHILILGICCVLTLSFAYALYLHSHVEFDDQMPTKLNTYLTKLKAMNDEQTRQHQLCHNNVKDSGETRIDCGGNCGVCEAPKVGDIVGTGDKVGCPTDKVEVITPTKLDNKVSYPFPSEREKSSFIFTIHDPWGQKNHIIAYYEGIGYLGLKCEGGCKHSFGDTWYVQVKCK